MGNNEASDAGSRPGPSALQPPSKKKRNHRGGKKKRPRKQSFAVSTEDGSGIQGGSARAEASARDTLYRLQSRNLSNTSLESEALLDHRLVSTPNTCARKGRQKLTIFKGTTEYATPQIFDYGSLSIWAADLR